MVLPYPLKEPIRLSMQIQESLGNYHTESSLSIFARHSPDKTREQEWDERNIKYEQITGKFMKEAGTNLLPQVQCVLAEIDAMLEKEEPSFA